MRQLPLTHRIFYHIKPYLDPIYMIEGPKCHTQDFLSYKSGIFCDDGKNAYAHEYQLEKKLTKHLDP